MEKIAEGIQIITGIGTAAVFAVNSTNGFILIDTGIFKKTHLLIAQLEKNNYPLRRLQTILLTHCHCDHIGGVTELVRHSGARVAAHVSDIPYIVQEQVVTGPYQPMMIQEQKVMKQFGCNIQQVDIALRAGEIIDVLGGLQVIHVPGHTPGSIALYQPERQIMFFGDVIRNHPRRGLQIGVPQDYNVDTPQTRRDAHQPLTYPTELALFSHGDPILENATRILREAVSDPLLTQER